MEKKLKDTSNEINIRKLCLIFLSAYVLLVFIFYALAGDQLRFRASRGNLTMPVADSAPAELSQGVVVEQLFHAKIQRLERVAVQCTTYYRPNAGTVTLVLLRQDSGEVLLQGEFDAAAVAEGQSLFLSAPEPLETVYETPLLLRLSTDSLSGEGIAPMIYSGGETEGFALGANGVPLDGIHEYIAHEIETIQKLDIDAINDALNLLLQTRNNGNIVYVFGNGGSSATASHFQNDL